MTPIRKQLLEEKVLAESLFKYKKANYDDLISRLFVQFRLSKSALQVICLDRLINRILFFFLQMKMN